MMRVAYAPRALRDLRAIVDFIAIDSPKRAQTFVAELRAACQSLTTESQRYPFLDTSGGYQRMPVGNYLVFYEITDESVRIVRVLHSARDLRDLSFN